MIDELQGLLRQYGLWVVFFGAMIEGDLTLLLAGVLARSGLFTFQEALLVGTSGGVAGDLLGKNVRPLYVGGRSRESSG